MKHAPRRLLIALTTILVCYCLSFPVVKSVTPLSACAPPREKCKWYHENTFVYGGKLGDSERKALDKLLDALVKAVDAGANEVSAVKKAIDELGPAGDVVDVVLVYACEDENGNITRKKFTLDNTENIHWAAKAAKDPSNAQSQRTIITKHTPQGSCCKPKQKPKTETANGVIRTTFETAQGKININLPDDMAAGDTVSGTVNVETAGNSDAERATNENQLNGCVIDLAGKKTNVDARMISLMFPVSIPVDAKMITLSCDGRPVATSEIPISATRPPTLNKFTLPTGGQQGQSIEIKGPFNGLFMPQDSVKIGETTVPPIAESPRKIVVSDTSQTTGPTKIELNENGTTAECQFRNLGIKLSAPRTNLVRGEKTEMHVEVSGLEGLTQNLPLKLVNSSTSVVKMSAGEIQNMEINSRAVQTNGTYSVDRTLTGIQPGSFIITGTVTWADTCTKDPTGGPISGGPGPVSQPPPSPTPLTPTDETEGEVCKWVNYKTYRVDDFKRVTSTNPNLEVRNESAHGGGTAVSFHCKAAGTFIFTVTKETGAADVVSVTCK